jgi:host factor-I protein
MAKIVVARHNKCPFPKVGRVLSGGSVKRDGKEVCEVSNNKETKVKVQEGYLNFLRKERIPVAVHFFTGMQLRGIVRGFDTYTIALELEGTNKQVLIFKHGILYVDPMRPVGDVVGRLITEAQQAEAAKQQVQRLKRPRRVPVKEPTGVAE